MSRPLQEGTTGKRRFSRPVNSESVFVHHLSKMIESGTQMCFLFCKTMQNSSAHAMRACSVPISVGVSTAIGPIWDLLRLIRNIFTS